LGEIYATHRLAPSIVPFPLNAPKLTWKVSRGFRAPVGASLIRELVNVQAAGGPAAGSGLKASDVTPDLSKAMTRETWQRARIPAIEMAFVFCPPRF